jgi:hypothetical protein
MHATHPPDHPITQSVASTSMTLPAGAPTRVEVRIRDAFGSVATAQARVSGQV